MYLCTVLCLFSTYIDRNDNCLVHATDYRTTDNLKHLKDSLIVGSCKSA